VRFAGGTSDRSLNAPARQGLSCRGDIESASETGAWQTAHAGRRAAATRAAAASVPVTGHTPRARTLLYACLYADPQPKEELC
jgi:hypothetical protein